MDESEKRRVLQERPWQAEGLPPPSDDDLEEWMDRDGGCEAACLAGCWVEPDGWCKHGRPSWLLALGMI